MKILSNDDTYADALSTAAFASIPLIAIGVMGMPVVLWISAILGSLFFLLFLIRFCLMLYRDAPIKTSKKLDVLMSTLQFPYVAMLAGLIFMLKGIDGELVLWMALLFAIGVTAYILFDPEAVNP